jgi:hypothetical protein
MQSSYQLGDVQMTTQMQVQQFPSLLRRVLLADAVFELAVGGAAVLASEPLADFTGLDQTLVFGVGVALLVVAAFLYWVASKEDRGLAKMVATENAVAVPLMILAMALLPLTTEGLVLLGIITVDVGIFSALQFYALSRK